MKCLTEFWYERVDGCYNLNPKQCRNNHHSCQKHIRILLSKIWVHFIILHIPISRYSGNKLLGPHSTNLKSFTHCGWEPLSDLWFLLNPVLTLMVFNHLKNNGNIISKTVFIACLPTMMMLSCMQSSVRQPPGPHCKKLSNKTDKVIC